ESRFQLVDDIDTPTVLASIGYESDTNLVIRNSVDEATVTLAARDTASADQNLLVGDPDGALTLYFAGSAIARTATAGTALEIDRGTGFEAVATTTDLDGITASNIDSEAATDGWVLTADGAGNAAWEPLPPDSLPSDPG